MIVKSVLACAGCAIFGEGRECATCNNNVNKEENVMKSVFGAPVGLHVANQVEVTTTLKDNVINLYVEQCNCGTQIKHNNGGNYHAVDKLHLIGDENGVYCVVLEKTTTREVFFGDKYEILTFQDGEFRLKDEERVAETYPVRFRQGEAEIIYQNPQAFVETRKPHAEELAATARAFGHEISWEEFLMDV